MEIKINLQSAIIMLLATCVLTMGAYFYRSYELQAMRVQIQNTQQVILQLGVDEKVATIFNNIGYQVNVQKPVTEPTGK
jgi:hypothetical protein